MSGKSPVEEIKAKSCGLRGTLAQTLAQPVDHFGEEENQLLKLHGMYQQDDRDLRTERKKAGLDKAWSLMIRTKQPAGKMSAEQYLALDALCGDIANGSLRLTTRQAIQFHGILKIHVKEAVQRIHHCGLTSWGACGDVVRNTMGPAAPLCDEAHRDAQRLAEELTQVFYAKSTAYAEVWLDGKKLEDGATEEEPIYGKVYLPRKFKIGIAVPPHNDVDIYSQDLGFVAEVRDGKLLGYTVLVGGGFGMSHGQTQTRPFLGQPLFFVKPEHAVEAAMAVVTMQRDHGNREDRKQARLKYLVHKQGIEWIRQEVVSRMKCPTAPSREVLFSEGVADRMGWHEQGDGKWFRTVWVAEGRIKDSENARYRSCFRAVAERFGFPMRVTPNTNLLVHDIPADKKTDLDQLLAEHGIGSTSGMTLARQMSHACVALPTCGLSLAEAERFFPEAMSQVDQVLRELGLGEEPLLVRMSGCPNGCSRPYNADIALVGRAPGKYALYMGGSYRGDRLVGLEKKAVGASEIGEMVRPYLAEFATRREAGESFSDYWGRSHTNGEAPHSEQFHTELEERKKRLEAAGEKPSAPE